MKKFLNKIPEKSNKMNIKIVMFLITIMVSLFAEISNAADIYITSNQKWSDFSTFPTSGDNIYVCNSAELTIDVADANCLGLYVGYETGADKGKGAVKFDPGSKLTIHSPDGILLGTTSYKGKLNMKNGGLLVTGSIYVFNTDVEFDEGDGTIAMTANNALPAEFDTYNNLIISGGTAILNTDITIEGDLTINGILDVSVSSYKINIKGNWINNGTLVQRNGDVIFKGNQSRTIGGSNTTEFYNITMEKISSASVVLVAPIAVKKTATLTKGIMYSDNTNKIIMGPDANTTGGSDKSYMEGPIKIDADTIRKIVIGTGKNGKYNEIAVKTSSVDPATYMVEYFDDEPVNVSSLGNGITHVSKEGYWNVERLSGTDSVSVIIHWDSKKGNGSISDPLLLKVARFDTTQWENEGNIATTGTTAKGSIESKLLKSFGSFTFGCSCGSGKSSGTCDNFKEYTELSGMSNEKVKGIPLNVKEEDNPVIDNEYTSSEESVIKEAGLPFSINIKPNPSNGDFNIYLSGNPVSGVPSQYINGTNPCGKTSEVLIVVIDLLGKEYYSKVVILEDDEYNLAIDCSENLNPGIYFVTGSSNDKFYNKKIVIR
ncbi:MAG: T9SS type A sorting domain-containing protein [Bacteroidota bacterium]